MRPTGVGFANIIIISLCFLFFFFLQFFGGFFSFVDGRAVSKLTNGRIYLGIYLALGMGISPHMKYGWWVYVNLADGRNKDV